MRSSWIFVTALALVPTGCGGDTPGQDAGDTSDTTTAGDSGSGEATGTADDTGGEPVYTDVEPGCDPLVPSVCAFPFPSMARLQADESIETGLRIAVPHEALPPSVPDPEPFAATF